MIYMVSYVMDASLLMRQSKELDINPKMFVGGGAGFTLPEFAKSAGDAADRRLLRHALDRRPCRSRAPRSTSTSSRRSTAPRPNTTAPRRTRAMYVVADALKRAKSIYAEGRPGRPGDDGHEDRLRAGQVHLLRQEDPAEQARHVRGPVAEGGAGGGVAEGVATKKYIYPTPPGKAASKPRTGSGVAAGRKIVRPAAYRCRMNRVAGGAPGRTREMHGHFPADPRGGDSQGRAVRPDRDRDDPHHGRHGDHQPGPRAVDDAGDVRDLRPQHDGGRPVLLALRRHAPPVPAGRRDPEVPPEPPHQGGDDPPREPGAHDGGDRDGADRDRPVHLLVGLQVHHHRATPTRPSTSGTSPSAWR